MAADDHFIIIYYFLTIAVTTPDVERSFNSMKRIKIFLWATMTDPRLSSLALIHIHRDFRVYVNSVTDSFNEKKNRKIKLIWTVTPSISIILTCSEHFFEYQNETDWEHLQVFSPEHMDVFFVYSLCTKKNQYSPMNKERIQNTWCVRRSDAWNVHQVFCKYRHVLYYVFPIIIALHRRILMFFFAHTEHVHVLRREHWTCSQSLSQIFLKCSGHVQII